MTPTSPQAPLTSQESALEVSLIIPARNANHSLDRTVRQAHQYLVGKFKSFEILLVPNSSPNDLNDQSEQIAKDLSHQFPEVRVCSHQGAPGKGAAIRTGYLAAQGDWIFFTDSDLPYDLEFFDEASKKLRQGYDLVTGNRRLPHSHFFVPVSLLRLTYGRHRLGLAFNFLVRLLLGIPTTDTQAGIKALSRKLAKEVFAKQTCPGFLFDLEIFLTAQGSGYKMAELPVVLHLNSEKSTVRVIRECFSVAYWVAKISLGKIQGHYGKPKAILPHYPRASWSTRIFLTLRWQLTPYRRMASRLPPRGKILDLGCGHGLFALTAALDSQERQILGIDHDLSRIALATEAAAGLKNLQIQEGTLARLPSLDKNYAAISIIDVLHYFDGSTQEDLLRKSRAMLEPGGTLLIREVDPDQGVVSSLNRWYEKIATASGFTRSGSKDLHFRTRQDWVRTIESVGFSVQSERCSSFLFADILYTCERN